jgi:soluble lytic murein transglycosylase-like protein
VARNIAIAVCIASILTAAVVSAKDQHNYALVGMQPYPSHLHGFLSSNLITEKDALKEFDRDDRYIIETYNAFKMGDWKTCEKRGRKIDAYETIADYVIYMRAFCAMEQKDNEKAISLLSGFDQRFSHSVLLPAALNMQAELLEREGYAHKALPLVTQAMSLVPEGSPLYDNGLLMKGGILIQSGKREEGIALWKNYISHIHSYEDVEDYLIYKKKYKISEELISNAEYIDASYSLLNSGDPEGALKLLQMLTITEELEPEMANRLLYVKAKSHERLGRFDDAVAVYGDMVFNDDQEDLKRHQRRLMTYIGERDASIEKDLKELRRARTQSEKDRLRYILGVRYFDSGDYKNALKMFDKTFKAKYLKNKSAWYRAWIAYKTKNYKTALARFKNIEKTSRKDRSRAEYWKGRILEEQGDAEGAKKVFTKLAEEAPFGFYNLIAATHANIPISYDRDAAGEDKKASIIERYISNDPYIAARMRHAYRCAELKISECVEMELRGVSLKQISSRDLENEVKHLAEQHDIADTIYFLNRRDVEGSLDEDFDGLSKLFPAPYTDVLMRMALTYGVDPYLAMAIIREESRYQPLVVSRAGAVGLMQLIPSTARRVYSKHNIPYENISSLFIPEINIEAGIKYLAELQEMFNGQIIYMISSYNAGEHNVKRWMKDSDEDMEIFIEEIPYSETNKYVKKVLKSYWMYKLLYEDQNTYPKVK